MFGLFKKDIKEKKITIKGLLEDEININSQNQTLLESALLNDIKFPHRCKAGGCGTCKCMLIEGEVKELKDSSYILSEDDLDNNYILACQSIPKTDIVVVVENKLKATK